jgi:riboflavin-specific deaminase-like protein
MWRRLLDARSGPIEQLEATLAPLLQAGQAAPGGPQSGDAELDLLYAEAAALLEARRVSARLGRPHVTLHFAQTLDGRLAATSGSSRWISGQASLVHAHRLRALNDAVLVGAVTARHDDPALTVRHVQGPQPCRFVIDTELRVMPQGQLLGTPPRTVFATTLRASAGGLQRLRGAGVEVWTVPGGPGRIDLAALLARMAQDGVTSLLVEGGARTLTSFIREGLCDRLVMCIAPLLLGEGIAAIGELGITELASARRFASHRYHRLQDDLIVDARLATPAA